jgi:hypothetical protein
MTLFGRPADYQQFGQVLAEARARTAMRILAYCLMPNQAPRALARARRRY